MAKRFFIGAILFSLIGCSSNDLSSKYAAFEFVHENAQKCTDEIYELVMENAEPYTFSFAYYVDSHSIPVLNASYTQTEKKAIPYIIVPTRETIPGTAWRACMSKNNAPVLNIQYLD